MKIFKAFIDEILDVKRLVTVLWFSLWYILIVCLICKYCFHMWFPIFSKNIYLIKVCDFIDENLILRHLVYLSLYVLNFGLVYLISTKQSKYSNKKELYIILTISIANYVIKNLSNIYGLLIEALILVVFPIITDTIKMKEKTFWKVLFLGVLYPIIVNAIIILWQSSIFLIRDIEDMMNTLPTLINLILQIDYYIFLIITFLGVKIFMSTLGVWLWCNEITKLEACIEEEKKKKEPNETIIKFIEKRIKKIKEKENV